jgi:UPF0176 protein
MNNVILYYKFAAIHEPKLFAKAHKEFCRSLNLMGRVYVSDEGINGTLAGTTEAIELYKRELAVMSEFEGTQFKEDLSDSIPFAKLIVKYRPEIVSLKADVEIKPFERRGNHLTPSQWRKVMETETDYVMIDARNNYESKIGHFEGAILPDLENFYDFPQWLNEVENEIPKEKKVLMYCTGGIRCEKFSLLMEAKGWKDVYQLDGGIINYGKVEGGAHFKGKCFVFDDRLVVPVNPAEEEPIAACEISGRPADTYLNCANMDCNKLFVCCPEAADKYKGCCSQECMDAPRVRPFDKENAFAPFRKWYHYFGEEFKQKSA